MIVLPIAKRNRFLKNIDIWCISSVAERRRESNGCFILVTMVFA